MWRTHGRVLCFIVLMGSGGLLRAQTNDEVYVKDKPDRTNYFEVVREYERYFANVPKTQLKIPGWKQYKRWEYFWSKRVDKDGNFPRPDISYIERKNIDAFHAKAKADNPLDIVATPNWKPVGPSGAPSSGGGAGRLNCITLSTKNKDLMWVGSAGGGAWKSTDGGKTWKAMTDDLPNLAVNDVALDPNDENVVYLGTGDDWGSGIVDFSQRELFRISFSIGIMKSTDGGASWQQTGLTWQTSQLESVAKILVDPSNSNIVIAATSEGIYKSANAGKTWVKKSTTRCRDLEIHPIDRKIWYASSNNAFMRSTDVGETWVVVNIANLPSQTRRTAITSSTLDPSTLYLVAANPNGGYSGLFRSTDAGQSWASRSTSPNILANDVGGISAQGQGWYDLALACNPTNQNTVFVGGINIWRSTNSGTGWGISAHWTGENQTPYVHADIHDMDFSHLTNDLYAATDGGLFKSTNNGETWSDASGNMEIHQFYRISIFENDPAFLLGGAQDNGSSRFSNNRWTQISGGDGMDNIISHSNKNVLFASSQGGNIVKSTDGGNSVDPIVSSFTTGEPGDWIAPMRMSSQDANKLYVGFLNVWTSDDGGDDWTRLGTIPNAQSTIHSLAISQSNPSWIYTCNKQNLFVSSNGGSTWLQRSIPAPALNLTTIAVHPTNHLRACITFARYGASTAYETTNGGQSWTDISSGLPKTPANSAMYQKGSADRLFVGTDVGLYYKEKSSPKFVDYNEGLPNVSIQDIEINYKTFKLLVGTFGRGIWEAQLPDCTAGTLDVVTKGDTTFCEGDSVVLEAATGYNSYSWSNGLKTRQIIVRESGDYSVSATDSKGCPYGSKTIVVKVNEKRDIAVLNSANQIICGVDSTRLSATIGFTSYNWSNGATGRMIYVKNSGKYFVTGETNEGCKSISAEIEVENVARPGLTSPTDGIFTSPIASKYQWRSDGKNITGETNRTFTADASYLGKKISVMITTEKGCEATSNEITYQLTGIEDYSDSQGMFKIVTNPVTNHLRIINACNSGTVNMSIYNSIGDKLFEKSIISQSAEESIPVHQYPTGVYWIKIDGCNVEKVLSFIIN